MESEPMYVVHHRASLYRGAVVRLIIRPSTKRKPNNVLAEMVSPGPVFGKGWPGLRFTCPWRGLRRWKPWPG